MIAQSAMLILNVNRSPVGLYHKLINGKELSDSSCLPIFIRINFPKVSASSNFF